MRRDLGRGIAVDLALLFAAKGALGAFLLSAGFTHVSDDDYARVVIAEQFAHHPALDPSGTSWLPFPFWVNGAAMLLFGRSLAVAQAVAFALGVLSVGLPYLGMRAVGCGRATSVGAVVVAASVPWSAWLGVATVPEEMTAALIAAGVIALIEPRARLLGSILLFCASLSRYEAWPACAVFAVGCAVFARSRTSRARDLVAAAVACAGPLAWMAWNAHAHGSPVHFLARVAAYRQAIGAASAPLSEKLTTFPRALLETSPLVVSAALLGAMALFLDPPTRARWAWPLASALSILAFLIYGDLRDGAPTHHPERAVLPILWLLAPFAADALRVLALRLVWARPQREMWLFGAASAGALAWAVTLPTRWSDFPGRAPDEERTAQIARGLALASAGSPLALEVTPCAYEHFALIAALGRPESVQITPRTVGGPGPGGLTVSPVTAACPTVELR